MEFFTITVLFESIRALLGILVGLGLPMFDYIVDAFFVHPDAPYAEPIRSAFRSKKYRDMKRAIHHAQQQHIRIPHTSAMFVLGMIVVACFVITSAQGVFAQSVVFGVTLAIAWPLMQMIRQHKIWAPIVQQYYFWDLVPASLEQHNFRTTRILTWTIIMTMVVSGIALLL